jgi:hypothetical protein
MSNLRPRTLDHSSKATAIKTFITDLEKHKRQSYLRIAKQDAMMAGRYARAKQFNRHRRHQRILRTRLGRIIPDISRKIAGQPTLEQAIESPGRSAACSEPSSASCDTSPPTSP